jgi:(p)ppGpp synthase/HD superfamily hydrolase
MNNAMLITSAASFAAEAHKHQVRKELNEPYIVHPIRVASMAARLGLADTDIAACYLHDVVEDTNTPMRTIVEQFPHRTAELVRALTKWWEEGHPSEVVKSNKDAYYHNIIRTDGAVILKILDRIDNLHDFARIARLSPANHPWAARYLEKTRHEFKVILDAAFGYTGQNQANAQIVRRWYDNALLNLEDAI